MERTPLRLLQLESDLNRSKLVTLEKLGLVQEGGEGGAYGRPSSSADAFPSSGDPVEDGKLRDFMLKKQFQADKSRERRVERLRRLARMDLRLIGGVSPVGGGSDSQFRPASIQPRM